MGIGRANIGHPLVLSTNLAESNSWLISVRKFNSSACKGLLDRRQAIGVTGITTNLNIIDRIPVEPRRFCQIPHGPI
jgi:hypothetical protein